MSRRLPVPSERTVLLFKIVLAVVLAATVAWLLFAVVALSRANNHLDARAERSTKTAQTALGAVDDLAAQVRALGGNPVIEPNQLPQPGPQGATGATGPQGLTGPQGVQGIPGPQGLKGAMGATGPVGPQGPAGEPGPKGEPGKDGKDGKDGAPGADGAAGAPGANGVDGRGVSSVTCSGPALFSFTFFYTDGTSDTVACSPAP